MAAPLSDVFQFFSDAANLQAITPPWLHFQVLTPPPIHIHRGTVIDYRLRVHGLPMRWQSEITAWDPPHRFVDEQRRGPYKRWVHTHTFVAERGGTTISDRVDYEVPFPLLSKWLVERDVRRIFAFRRATLETLARSGWVQPESAQP